MIANRLQDASPGLTITSSSLMRSSTSLILLLYYLALSISPTPSIYNNIGIILRSLPASRVYTKPTGDQETLTGTTLARIYYERGLTLHPVNMCLFC